MIIVKEVFALIFLFILSFNSLKASDRPNIIWLMAEDISLDLECYGMKAVKTPTLNRLADEGIKFTNCYTTNPICSPSRSAMMTGVDQLKINAQHHRSNRNVPLSKPYKPFTSLLRDTGYTCILGSEHVMGRGRKTDCNFKHEAVGSYDGVENFGLFDKFDVITPEDQPFFAQIQLVATHRGDWWDEVRTKSAHPVDPDLVELPPYIADTPITRLDWAKYLDQMEYIDEEINAIINDLKKKGLYENTIIIFIGDNGRCNIFGKGYLHDTGLHVPLIVNWPRKIQGNQVRADMVSSVDITATILDWAGVKIPSYMTGKSFIRSDFKRDYVFGSRDLWDEIMEKSRSVSTPQFSYIRNDMPWIPWDAHQTYLEFYRPAVHVMRKLKLEGKLNEDAQTFLSPGKPKEELYDRKNDPHELNNLADTPEYQSVLREMRKLASKEEKAMRPVSDIFQPVYPGSIDVYDFVKYMYPEEYQEMLNGKEIGFQKFLKIYKEHLEKINNQNKIEN